MSVRVDAGIRILKGAAMSEDIVEKKLQSLLEAVESQVRTYLQWCESPAERLLLLEFMSLPGVQPAGCSGEARPERIRMFSGGILDSANGLPVAESEHGEWVPTGLVWLDERTQHRVFYHEKKSECCRLLPKFRVKDNETGEVVCCVDFALFWPRGDGKGHIKVAIECNGDDNQEKTGDQAGLGEEERRFLQNRGWIIARLTASEIQGDPGAIVLKMEDLVLAAKREIWKERRTP